MSWEETWIMSNRIKAVECIRSGSRTVSGISRQYGWSRKTMYKWLKRYDQEGVDGLHSQSRASATHPNQTDEGTQKELLRVRKDHPTWGPRKILAFLTRECPQKSYPAASTVGSIFKRHGVVKPRRDWPPKDLRPGRLTEAHQPNDVWTADFKGNFLLKNGVRCYPLTIVDRFSRFILSCEGMAQPRKEPCQKEFERVFAKYGLPRVIRTDNGEPFASCGLWRLTPLSVWWMKLGIRPEQIDLGRPEQNGRHERMHRELKSAATRPPSSSLRGQQRRFDEFVADYNEIRPHEALGQERPFQKYRPSERSYPRTFRTPTYPRHYEIRHVIPNGTLSWRSELIYVTSSLAGEPVGLLEIEDGVWQVHYDGLELGVFDLTQKIRPGTIRKVLPMRPV